MNRRDFCKLSVSAVVAGIWGKAFGISTAGAALPEKQEKAKVYFIRDITPENLVKLYEKVNQEFIPWSFYKQHHHILNNRRKERFPRVFQYQ